MFLVFAREAIDSTPAGANSSLHSAATVFDKLKYYWDSSPKEGPAVMVYASRGLKGEQMRAIYLLTPQTWHKGSYSELKVGSHAIGRAGTPPPCLNSMAPHIPSIMLTQFKTEADKRRWQAAE